MTTSRDAALPAEADDLREPGYLLLPTFAEPHAHLDKAFLAERVVNVTGDLMGAILAMRAARPSITVADTAERAQRAALLMLANGTTAIRTHADVNEDNGLCSIEALLDVRERLRGRVHIQIVALAGFPCLGPEGATNRALLAEAIAMGVDVVGGCPHLEVDPHAANELFLTMAAEAGLPVDLHTDETLDPRLIALDDLARRVPASGFPHAVAASHCVSLGMQPEARQREIADAVAAAGIDVIALPHTNLFLQGRDHPAPMPRALTAVRALRAAGVNVAAGADNLQDPFNPVGRGDPLETASLMVMTAHLLPQEALDTVSVNARRAMGLPESQEAVAVRAATVREAIAFGPPGRVLVRDSAIMPAHES